MGCLVSGINAKHHRPRGSPRCGWKGAFTSGAGLEAGWLRTCDSGVSPRLVQGTWWAQAGRAQGKGTESWLQRTQKGKQGVPRN